jgi:hypothetical protein
MLHRRSESLDNSTEFVIMFVHAETMGFSHRQLRRITLMTPLDLLQILQSRGVLSRIKDMKTSLRKLADTSQVSLT